MEQSIFGKIKEELRMMGVEPSQLEHLSKGTPLNKVLKNPFHAIRLFQNVGIPLESYGFNPNNLYLSKDFMWRPISGEGYDMILNAGNYSGRPERARELAEAGAKSIAHLYTQLNFQDIIDVCEFESAALAASA